jgi:hypothetical protein
VELWGFIKAHFGLGIPHRSFTPGHSTPLDFIAEAFFHPRQDIAVWANRSGIKTLGASILAAMEFLFTDGIQGRVLSGSEDQARNLYGYWQNWCNGVLAGRLDDRRVNRLLTKVGRGRFEILAASQKRVRGPKVQRLYEDELDEIDEEIDAAAVGMIASADGIPGRTIYTSTWHRPDGLMARLVDGCDQRGVRLLRWNLWESIENCPPDRHEEGRGCRRCPLEPACVAKAREFHEDADWPVGIAAEACGLYRLDDVIKAYRKVSALTWDAEFLCKRPSAEGLIYPQFDERVHRCNRPPAELTIYRAIDWGHGVFVCLWIGEDKDGCAYLLDTYRAELGTVHQHAEYIKAHRLRDAADTFCDPAGRNRNDQTGRSNVEVFRRHGIRCSYSLSPKAREVRNGILLVRAALRPASGPPRFRYVPGETNRTFVRAMQSYRSRKVNGVWLDEPQDPQECEHVPDALRYYFVNRNLPRGVAVVGYGTR